MPYMIRRYAHGASRYKAWFLLALLMPGLYLLAAFYSPDQHTISQKIFASETTRFLLSEAELSADELIRSQNAFFASSSPLNTSSSPAITDALSLSSGKEGLTVSYLGSNLEQGKSLVSHHASRIKEAALPQNDATSVGPLQTTPVRSLWRPDHVGPATLLLLGSFTCVLILIGALEWNDAALKSERQIARYVGLPVLGSLPNLDVIELDATNPTLQDEEHPTI